MSELKTRVDELKMENEYQLRLKDMNYNEKTKELRDKFVQEIESLQAINEVGLTPPRVPIHVHLLFASHIVRPYETTGRRKTQNMLKRSKSSLSDRTEPWRNWVSGCQEGGVRMCQEGGVRMCLEGGVRMCLEGRVRMCLEGESGCVWREESGCVWREESGCVWREDFGYRCTD